MRDYFHTFFNIFLEYDSMARPLFIINTIISPRRSGGKFHPLPRL